MLASDWYAEMVGAPLEPLDRALAEAYPAPLLAAATRLPALRGLLAFHHARTARGLALIAAEPGTMTLLLCEAWLRRRRAVVLLELIERRPRRRLRRLAYRAWNVAVLGPTMRRALAGAQVLTAEEQRHRAAELGPGIAPVRLIGWARSSGSAPEPTPRARAGVLASGRAWCDWETLFTAARGADWPLTVVCGAADRERVAELNRDRRARVLSEIPLDEHDRLLASAAICAIVLDPAAPSAGHVRLMEATDAGTPVVATDVPALDGYIERAETARVVPPADPAALRAAIEALLAAPEEAERLATAARARARGWTYDEYFAAIRELIEDSLGPERRSDEER